MIMKLCLLLPNERISSLLPLGNGGGPLTAHVSPPVLGDQLALLVDHRQHRDAGDAKVRLEGLDLNYLIYI